MVPSRRLQGIVLASLLLLSSGVDAAPEDNEDYADAYIGWMGALVAVLPPSFVPGPTGDGASLAAIGIDMIIPTLPAWFLNPGDKTFEPNTADQCHYDATIVRTEANYQNVLGFDAKDLPTDWGDLGTPIVAHANAEVVVRVESPFLTNWPDDSDVLFPTGSTSLRWTAATQWDPLLDTAIPAALYFIATKTTYGKAFFQVQLAPKTAARSIETGLLILINAAIEAGIVTAGMIEENRSIDAGIHQQTQKINVLDALPPTISAEGEVAVQIEATDFGGELWERQEDFFTGLVTAEDPCGLPIFLSNDAPAILPLGTTRVTWTAKDNRALAPGNPGMASVFKDITVADTLAPILLPPPNRVLESSTTAGLSDVDIGTAVVFDLADPDVEIDNTSPSSFPVDQRVEVLWTATDDSGNSAEKSQWITVKTPGTNTAPTVSNVSETVLTSEVIDLELIGSDPDFLSGRFDPLNFRITDKPDNGFFVAPLVPYFIEDYRVKPNDDLGVILNNPQQQFVATDLYNTYCQNGDPIPRDFPYRPKYVHIDDDGNSYVLDQYWNCGPDDQSTEPLYRVAKFNAEGEYQFQSSAAELDERIYVDRDGFVYQISLESEFLFMKKMNANLGTEQSWRLGASTPDGKPDHITAIYDPATGLIFANDKRVLFAYDGDDGNFEPAYVGALMGGAEFLSNEPSILGDDFRGYIMELDSEGNLYVADSGADRIYKFGPSSWDGSTFTPGALIGWMGKCTSGTNCDNSNQRSIGYSCTNATCSGNDSGSLPGQFNTPLGIALDPSDILYVTDYVNERVQRFTPLGDFAGEAKSTCDGTCFVLGDMGRPRDISVNSTAFHVLDRDRFLMHVFETAPFKDITDNSVIVSYSSNNDFQGVDTFQYRANDGLVDSNTGTATITVNRAFRPPQAFGDVIFVDEDDSIGITLEATDPDGIAGIDFNGLETLTYTILELPEHGQLTGAGNSWTYTPSANYEGPDQLVFKVNDGVFDSDLATVSITVSPVNDPPLPYFLSEGSALMTAEVAALAAANTVSEEFTAPLGFPVRVRGEFTDPDVGQAHFLVGNWGDGENFGVNQNPPAEPDGTFNEPIVTKSFSGVGQFIASHTYLTPGVKDVYFNVIDAAGAGSNSEESLRAEITVVPMVDVSMEPIEISGTATPGEPSSLLIEVTNELPESPVVGLTANNVQFSGYAPEGALVTGISTSQGSCSAPGNVVTCDLGALSPGQIVEITIQFLTDPNFDSEMFGYTVDATSTEPDATGTNTAIIGIPVMPQNIFFDDFE